MPQKKKAKLATSKEKTERISQCRLEKQEKQQTIKFGEGGEQLDRRLLCARITGLNREVSEGKADV